ncbi:hypothetical protein CPC08DRAFT_729695 [Agrocybe pediades]|nr:hypothetical protein CPC08DRAFT_729695 [Agrocybe pediades]
MSSTFTLRRRTSHRFNETGNQLYLRPEPEQLQEAATIILRGVSARNEHVTPDDMLLPFQYFCEEREIKCKLIKSSESPEERAKRERRQKSRDDGSSKVFVWRKRWHVYSRAKVPSNENQEVIEYYKRHGSAVYNDIFDEWDCYMKLDEDGIDNNESPAASTLDNETDIPFIQEEMTYVREEDPQQTTTDSDQESVLSFGEDEPPNYWDNIVKSLNGFYSLHSDARFYTLDSLPTVVMEEYEPLHILHECMGFTTSLTIAASEEKASKTYDNNFKTIFCKLIGMIRVDDAFFQCSVAEEATRFVDSLTSPSTCDLPSYVNWDLHASNRMPLANYEITKQIVKMRKNTSNS